MRIVFLGTGEIGFPALRALAGSPAHEVVGVVTQPDKPVGRRQIVRPVPMKRLAEELGISPVLQPPRIKAPEAVKAVASLEPEVIVVMAYGQILSKPLLEVPRVAILNLHASILPRHRGAAPIQAAIRNGDAETGITVLHVSVGLDSGDLVLTRPLEIREGETGQSLHDRLADLGPEAILNALETLGNGTAARIPQDEEIATYAPKLTREDGRIDWSNSAREIERMIRAYHPWPGTTTTFADRHGAVRRMKVFPPVEVGPGAGGTPGQVIEAGSEGILVQAGDGSLLLHELQAEGRRRMAAEAFLRGTSLESGTRLGG